MIFGFNNDAGRPVALLSALWRRGDTEIPKQSRHDPQVLSRYRSEHMLIWRMLRTRRVGMRHPDGWQTQCVREDVVRNRAAEIRQDRRSPAHGMANGLISNSQFACRSSKNGTGSSIGNQTLSFSPVWRHGDARRALSRVKKFPA